MNIRSRASLFKQTRGKHGYRNDQIDDNATPFLNLEELQREEKSTEKTMRRIQKIILAKCHDKIKRTNKTTQYRECYYDIPTYLPGYPVFDINSTKFFIANELIKNGLYVEDAEYTRLYISWKPQDINQRIYKKQANKMVKNKNIYKVSVSPLDTRKKSKKNSKDVDNQIAMYQYDNQIEDMIPVNTKRMPEQQQQQKQEVERKTLNLDPYKGERKKQYYKEDTYDKEVHRRRYRDNSFDLDEKYMPH